jgi:hypothetical protein
VIFVQRYTYLRFSYNKDILINVGTFRYKCYQSLDVAYPVLKGSGFERLITYNSQNPIKELSVIEERTHLYKKEKCCVPLTSYMYMYVQIKTISSPQSKWQIKSFTLPFFKITELAVIVADRLIVKM